MAGEQLRAATGTMFRKYPVWPLSGMPQEWIDRSHPDYEESLFQGPSWELDPISMVEIKGRPEHVTKGLRGMMKKHRQRALGFSEDIDDLGVFLRKLLSGTWWHRRSTPPPMDEMVTMAASRRRGALFGEPVGTSLTKYPGLPGFGSKLLRTTVEFGGDPLKNVLFHQWKPHAGVMNEIYAETMVELANRFPDIKYVTNFSDLKSIVTAPDFNELYTVNLERAGYKGLLYSPHERYAEYELKMFPGGAAPGMGSSWVHPLDMRKPHDPEVERYEKMVGEKLINEWRKWADTGDYHHLKEHYGLIDLEKVARKIGGESKLDVVAGKLAEVLTPKKKPILTEDDIKIAKIQHIKKLKSKAKMAYGDATSLKPGTTEGYDVNVAIANWATEMGIGHQTATSLIVESVSKMTDESVSNFASALETQLKGGPGTNVANAHNLMVQAAAVKKEFLEGKITPNKFTAKMDHLSHLMGKLGGEKVLYKVTESSEPGGMAKIKGKPLLSKDSVLNAVKLIKKWDKQQIPDELILESGSMKKLMKATGLQGDEIISYALDNDWMTLWDYAKGGGK